MELFKALNNRETVEKVLKICKWEDVFVKETKINRFNDSTVIYFGFEQEEATIENLAKRLNKIYTDAKIKIDNKKIIVF